MVLYQRCVIFLRVPGRITAYASLLAHEGAWNADVVHPNVHPNNISLYESPNGEWVGMLGGWASVGDECRTPENKVRAMINDLIQYTNIMT